LKLPAQMGMLKDIIPAFLFKYMYLTTIIGLWGVFLGVSNFSISRSGFKVWPYSITYFLVVLLASSSAVLDPIVSPLSWIFLAATITDRCLQYVDEAKIQIVGVKLLNIYSSRLRLLAAIGTNAIGMLVSGWALNNIPPATFHNVPTQIVGIHGLWEVVLCLTFLDNKTLKVKHYPMMTYFLLSSLASQDSAIWLLSLLFFFLELGVTFSHKIGYPIPVGEWLTVSSVIVGFITSIWVLCYVSSVGYLGVSSKLVALYGAREFISCIPDFDNWRKKNRGFLTRPAFFVVSVYASHFDVFPKNARVHRDVESFLELFCGGLIFRVCKTN